MAWILLSIAGLLETGWAIGLKYTDGFRRPTPTLITISLIIASMFLLAQASRDLPIGTAYTVWVGIGAFGASIMGILLFKEPITASRLFFLGLLAVSIIGLKLSH